MSAPDTVHSPLPWTVGDILHLSAKVDVEYAVKACNHHDRLVAALQGLSGLAMSGYHTTHLKPAAAAARALLAEIESAER